MGCKNKEFSSVLDSGKAQNTNKKILAQNNLRKTVSLSM